MWLCEPRNDEDLMASELSAMARSDSAAHPSLLLRSRQHSSSSAPDSRLGFFERACVLHRNDFGKAQRVQSWCIHAWSTAYSSLTWTTLGIGNKTCVLRLRVYCRLGSTIKRRNIRSAFACCVPLEVYAKSLGDKHQIRIFVAMSSFISALSEAQTNNSNIIHILGGIWWLSRGTNHCSHTSQWTFQNREMWFRAMLRS